MVEGEGIGEYSEQSLPFMVKNPPKARIWQIFDRPQRLILEKSKNLVNSAKLSKIVRYPFYSS
jgi:hypothetical protein